MAFETPDAELLPAMSLALLGPAADAQNEKGVMTLASFEEKERARMLVALAIQSGRLQRQRCEVCGIADAHAHHPDYSRPLDVQWLCRKHHKQEHSRLLRLSRGDVEPLKLLSARIPDEMHHELKLYAHEQGITLGQAIRRALEKYAARAEEADDGNQ